MSSKIPAVVIPLTKITTSSSPQSSSVVEWLVNWSQDGGEAFLERNSWIRIYEQEKRGFRVRWVDIISLILSKVLHYVLIHILLNHQQLFTCEVLLTKRESRISSRYLLRSERSGDLFIHLIPLNFRCSKSLFTKILFYFLSMLAVWRWCQNFAKPLLNSR